VRYNETDLFGPVRGESWLCGVEVNRETDLFGRTRGESWLCGVEVNRETDLFGRTRSAGVTRPGRSNPD
jgi:hypothetical protein